MTANRKILIAMSLLLVSIFASFSVTFAWFSTSNSVTALFTITIKEGNDILNIATDDDKKIGSERTDEFGGTNIELEDLTLSKAGGSWAFVDSEHKGANKTDYLVQEYTLYTNNPKKEVFLLTTDSTVTSREMTRSFTSVDKSYWLKMGAADEKIAAFYGTTDISQTNDYVNTLSFGSGADARTYYFNSSSGAYSTSAAYATRMMFISGHDDHMNVPANPLVWQPNADKGYDIKTENGEYVYDQVSSYYNNTFGEFFEVLPTDRTDSANITEYNTFTKDTAVVSSADWRKVDGSEPDYYEKVHYRAKITVVLWLEGKDADCFNAIIGDTLHTNLTLKLL